MLVGRNLQGHALHDSQAEAFQAVDLAGVVGHHAQLRQAQVSQDLVADAVVAPVRLEAQVHVGLDGVHPLLHLELVGPQLVDQADAAALLPHVDDGALAGVCDRFQRRLKLRTAVASQGAHHVPGEAFAVDADEDGIVMDDRLSVGREPPHAADAKGDMWLRIDDRRIGNQVKCPGLEFDVHLDGAADELLATQAVTDDVGHAAHLELVGRAKSLQVVPAGHGAVGVHDFADDAHRLETGQPGQVDGPFGLSGPDEHAAVVGSQRKHVAGPHEVGRPGVVAGDQADGPRAVGGRNARGDPRGRVDRYRKCRAVEGRVLRHLREQDQLVGAGVGQGQADHAAAVRGHEVDDSRRDFLGGADEVALVLAGLVVHQDNHPPGLQVHQDVFNRIHGSRNRRLRPAAFARPR